LAALFLSAGCARMSEEEALEAAREEIRREMQPEIDRRKAQIEDLRRRIAESKARIAAKKQKLESADSR
jgi:septal ring factor EnvC (AmiA/AmiB activator)